MAHYLVVNGWSANEAIWQKFHSLLSANDTFDVLNLDHVGDLDYWIKRIDDAVLPNTVLVGWSLGGTLVMAYASRYRSRSERVKAVITLQANPCFVDKPDWHSAMSPLIFDQFKELVAQADKNDLVRHFSFLMVQSGSYARKELAQIKKLVSVDTLPNHDALNSSLGLLETLDVRSLLFQISVPVMHVLGSEDVLAPRELADEYAKLAGRHEVVVIDGMAHVPCLAYADKVVEHIQTFMAVEHA